MAIDPIRFIYSLAGRLIAGEWTPGHLNLNLKSAMDDSFLRVPKFGERIFTAFPTRPAFGELVHFLRADQGLARAVSRSASGSVDLVLKRLRSSARPGPTVAPPSGLQGLVLPSLSSEADVARWFKIQPERLRWLADIAGRNRRHPAGPLRPYRYRWIPRRRHFPRLLEIPKVTLKQMQRKILEEILDLVPAHTAAHGFCRGRSIVTNAVAHCGKATVLRFDLVDFFPSITSARVFRIFRTIGYPADVARVFMGLCTTQLPADIWDTCPNAREGADFIVRQQFITRHLPQGGPASPALANLAAHRLDRRLSGLAFAAEGGYTRYADDLTFSGGAELARCRKRLGDYVAMIAEEEGFRLNFRKTRILRAGVRQHVAGVVVNIHPNIPRAEFDRLKAVLTNCLRHHPPSQNRDGHADFRAYLAGKISYVYSINPARGKKLRRIFQQINWQTPVE